MDKENISQIQKRLAQAVEADPNYRAKRLYNLVYHPDWLAYALERVLQNRGSQTAGIDGITVQKFREEGYKEKFLRELTTDLKQGTYRPQPCHRVYIPKPHKPNQKRPLGIAVIADRTAQTVVKMLIDPPHIRRRVSPLLVWFQTVPLNPPSFRKNNAFPQSFQWPLALDD